MARRLSAVRWASERPRQGWPSISTSPSSGRSRRPAMCSRVDLPAPEGPTRATISPPATLKAAPCSTSSRSRPWRNTRRTSRSSRPWPLRLPTWAKPALPIAPLLIAERLHRIEAGGAPRRIERREEGENEREADDDDDLPRVDHRRQAREEVDFRLEELRAGHGLENLADGLDVLRESEAEHEAEGGADHADAGAAQEEDAHDHAARGPHG